MRGSHGRSGRPRWPTAGLSVRSDLPARAGYRARWSDLHGGYDPAGSPVVNGWLALAEAVARPLARRGVSPNALTAAGLGVAAAALPVAYPGGRRPLLASVAVIGSGLVDNLDGAVAILTDRATPWGYLLDSLADRLADAVYLAALARVGASHRLTAAAAAGTFTLEYARARAGNAGLGEIGVVTVGERPTRIIVTAAGLAVAGLRPRDARIAATMTTAALTGLTVVGAGQFLLVAAGKLGVGQAGQAGPTRPATARADNATRGNPPPG